MSREIKFRAWDLDKNKYHYDICIKPNGKIIALEIYDGEMLPIRSRCIAEQYTGLKDKNGKEIYEGDIVAQELIDDPFAGGYPTYVVCWDEEFLGWALKDTTGDDGNDTDLHFFIAERRKCEIVGNIHENPELLEVKYEQE